MPRLRLNERQANTRAVYQRRTRSQQGKGQSDRTFTTQAVHQFEPLKEPWCAARRRGRLIQAPMPGPIRVQSKNTISCSLPAPKIIVVKLSKQVVVSLSVTLRVPDARRGNGLHSGREIRS